jgi:hypothetical protein
MSVDTNPNTLVRGGNVTLWINLLAAPLLWSGQMLVNYALVPKVCPAGNRWLLHVVWIASLLIVAGIGASARRNWQVLSRAEDPQYERPRFMAKVGFLVCALFAVLILSQGVACFIIDPCFK